MSAPAPIIFVHIPKTAGSTLRSIIRKQYGEDHLLYLRALNSTDLNQQQPEVEEAQKERDIRGISGHVMFGVHQFVDSAFQYVTILREPISRVISDYYYVLQTPTHDLHETVIANDYSLREYVTSGTTIYADNVQTRIVAGVGGDIPVGECTRDHLEQAKRNLQDHFSVVGLTEYFNESITLMKRQLGWGYPMYKTRNKTSNRPSRREVSTETKHVIREHNTLDVELHQFVRERFVAQLQEQPDSFFRDLQMLDALNTFYAPAVRTYITARKGINDLLGRDEW
jgi:hypothetical protein